MVNGRYSGCNETQTGDDKVSQYDRFANDLSDDLFQSVYSDLQKRAEAAQRAIYDACKKHRKGQAPADYYVGEAAEMFSRFGAGKASLGEALDFLKIEEAYRPLNNVR